MEHFWDLLFQLMKHGTNTLHVAFIFLFSVHFPNYFKLKHGLYVINVDVFLWKIMNDVESVFLEMLLEMC